jgi:high affinity choline transporter 7
MAVSIPGVIAIAVFYLLILIIGIIAARKSGLKIKGLSRDEVLLAGRNMGLFVGVFTMTGKTKSLVLK